MTIRLTLIVVVVAGLFAGCGDSEEAFDYQTHTVRKGDVRIFIRQKGTIEARDPFRVNNPMEGSSTTILEIIPEGSYVKKGDFIFELDVSEYEDRKLEQEISTSNAEQALHSAKQELEIQKQQNESDIKKGELDVLFADMDLEQYMEGELPNERDSIEAQITLSEEERNRAAETLSWSEKLHVKGYIATDRLKSDQLAVKRRKLDETLNRRQLDLLNKYTARKKERELTSNTEEAKRELERIKIRAAAAESKALADVTHKTKSWELEKSKLERINFQLQHAKVHAEREGIIVYGREGRGRDSKPIEPGSKVREGQMIVSIPDMSKVEVDIDVHESGVHMIARGMPVIITTDTGESLLGEIETIATVPDSQSWYRNPDLKVYSTKVTVENTSGKLRPGMNCFAEIVINELTDVISIPVQAAHSNGEKTFCYVKGDDGRAELREIEVGLHNGVVVHVTEGVSEGEEVYLAIPPDSPQIPVKKAKKVEVPKKAKKPETANGGRRAERGERRGNGGRRRPSAEDMERWKNMSEEERREAMKKMREGRGGRGGRGPGSGPGRVERDND